MPVFSSLLRDVVPRLYQETILNECVKGNTLVVLPTGLGKTMIALLLSAVRLVQHPSSKILVLAPTKPLAEQHLRTFQSHMSLPEEQFSLFTGDILPERRRELWQSSKIIFSTPQTVENDILTQSALLKDVSLLVVDEAHRAVGDYSYVFVASQYIVKSSFPHLLAMTASPGDTIEHISDVCRNLHIDNVEVRSEDDADVKPYVQESSVEWFGVELPSELLVIKKFLDDCSKAKLSEAKSLGYVRSVDSSKTEILALQSQLHGEISRGGAKDVSLLRTISLLAEVLKVQHALELLESQGVYQLLFYLEGIESQSLSSKVRAVQNLVRDPLFRSALVKTRLAIESGIEHPKFAKLCDFVLQQLKETPKGKVIVFTQFRDTAVRVCEELSKFNVVSGVFVGQAKKKTTGLSQKEQLSMLQDFRAGVFSCLICTSVGEEGLDIPQVDLVVFYEPVPSSIRTIQRRGRTARTSYGKIIVLFAKNTRDEAYRWSAHHKEKRMNRLLKDLKSKILFNASSFNPSPSSFPSNSSLPSNSSSNSLSNSSSNFSSSLSPSSQLSSSAQSELSVFSVSKSSQQSSEKSSQQNSQNYSQESSENSSQKFSSRFSSRIYVDYREKGSGTAKVLVGLGADVMMQQLTVGDYILSSRVGVELKLVPDFVDSLIDGRLLEQLKLLKNNFERPLVVVEGSEDIFSVRNIHPNAIRGMLATIAVSYGIPLLFTRNNQETALLLLSIAKREQEESSSSFSPHSEKSVRTLRDSQEFIISALPNVGLQTAHSLLREFKSVLAIANASIEDLKRVDGIGDILAKKIYDVFHGTFEEFEVK